MARPDQPPGASGVNQPRQVLRRDAQEVRQDERRFRARSDHETLRSAHGGNRSRRDVVPSQAGFIPPWLVSSCLMSFLFFVCSLGASRLSGCLHRRRVLSRRLLFLWCRRGAAFLLRYCSVGSSFIYRTRYQAYIM